MSKTSIVDLTLPQYRGITFSDPIRGLCFFVAPLHLASSLFLLFFFPRPSFLPFLECLHTFLRLVLNFGNARKTNQFLVVLVVQAQS